MGRFSRRQLSVLSGIVDALLPSIAAPHSTLARAKDAQECEEIRKYCEYRLSSDPDFMAALETSIFDKVSGQESQLLRMLLSILSTMLGTMLIFGILQPLWTFKSFAEYSTDEQSALLQSLKASTFQEKRKIFNGLKRLICGLAYSFVPGDGSGRGNPFWSAIGYPGPPQRNLSKEEDEDRMKEGAKIDFRSMAGVLLDVQGDMELQFDVVIVGSGCGGGVAAATLAKAGYSVIVLEKGPYLSPSEITNLEAESLDRMFESHGILTSSDGNVMMLAGSTLGGGSAINWSCGLETPEHVRREWIEKYGLVQFGDGYDEHMTAIKEQVGCDDKSGVKHNKLNQHLIDSCKTMGYDCDSAALVMRNSDKDATGFLCFGDRYGNKNDGLSTYLKDAVDHGAKIIENCAVHKILMESTGSSRGKRATGVIAKVGSYQLTINAKRCVVVAAGSLNTPCVLLRSGLKNKHVGRHLHVHPVIIAVGLFDKEADINCYLKAPMTTVCNEFQMGPQGNGYGPKIECPSTHTGLMGAALPFTSPEEYKLRMLRLRHALPYILLMRDSSEGRVRVGPDGFSPQIDYVLNDDDKESFLHSLKGVVKLLVATGANLVLTGHCQDPSLQLGDEVPRTKESIEANPQIQAYLDSITDRGMKEHEMGVYVAHQMGSCRMSTSPGGVVDSSGETWECNDLFLMDTSAFPTASGANPMLTVLAISHMLSLRLVERLNNEDEG